MINCKQVKFDGKEYMAYKTFPINVALIRGTTADPDGNMSMEREVSLSILKFGQLFLGTSS